MKKYIDVKQKKEEKKIQKVGNLIELRNRKKLIYVYIFVNKIFLILLFDKKVLRRKRAIILLLV